MEDCNARDRDESEDDQKFSKCSLFHTYTFAGNQIKSI